MAHRAPPPTNALRLLQEFVNTNDIEAERDALGSPAQLGAWLAERELGSPDEAPDEGQWQRMLAVREGLRALGRANNGEPLDRGRLVELNRAAADAPLVVNVGSHGWSLRPGDEGSDADRFIGSVLATLTSAMADGSWSRVKACRNDACRWLFFDHSRNRSGTWCTMAICGSRMKSRSYRSRRRAAAE